MAKPVVKIENLSKRYFIATEQGAAYNTLVDTISSQFRSWKQALFHPTSTQLIPRSEPFWALEDINFTIEEGDRVGIIGRNGAGKSTLLRILSRIAYPTSGKVFIRGRVACLLEVGAGFHPELTGRENIFLNGAILGMTPKEIRRKFDEIVAFSELERFLDTPIKRYSSGMFMRLGFAIAAHLDPDLLIVDEVLAVGDQQFQAKCLKKLGEINQQGRTILFVSHDIGAVISLCNKAMFLDKGRLVESGPIDQCVSSYMKRYQVNSMAWEGDLGNENIRFYRAALKTPEEGRPFVYQKESVVLELDYEVLKPSPDLIVGCTLWNRLQQIVGSSYTCDNPHTFSQFYQPGRHRAHFHLDTTHFYEGDYTVRLECMIHNQSKIPLDELILKLPIYEMEKNTRYAQNQERRRGVFLGSAWSRL